MTRPLTVTKTLIFLPGGNYRKNFIIFAVNSIYQKCSGLVAVLSTYLGRIGSSSMDDVVRLRTKVRLDLLGGLVLLGDADLFSI